MPKWLKKYNPKIDERFKTTDAPGSTGEALYMAEKPVPSWLTWDISKLILFATRFPV